MSDNTFAQATGDTQKLKPPAYRNQLVVLPSQRDHRQGSPNAKVVLL
ncbi:hypothetical protein NIES4075_72430 [Tolypothrix sp. NIES-4075]|nr:hypothetical protein [Tolypothrix sp. NIES-4075]GAX46222.1 hypothetical protein NIES4075_72430 [Tolypothrix sp. NIES-4075]